MIITVEAVEVLMFLQNYNLTGTWTWDERVRVDAPTDNWGFLMVHNTRLSGLYNDINDDAQLVLRDANGNADVFLRADNTSEFSNEINVIGNKVVHVGDSETVHEGMMDYHNGPSDNYVLKWDGAQNKAGWELEAAFQGLQNGSNNLSENLEFTIESVNDYGIKLDTAAVSITLRDESSGILIDNGLPELLGVTVNDIEIGAPEAIASKGYVDSKLGVKAPVSLTATDTIEVSHLNRIIQLNSASDTPIYLPDIGEPGDFLIFYQKGAGKIEPVAIGDASFVEDRRTNGQYKRLPCFKDADGDWTCDDLYGETFTPPAVTFNYPNASNPNPEMVDDRAWSIGGNQNSIPGIWTSNNQRLLRLQTVVIL